MLGASRLPGLASVQLTWRNGVQMKYETKLRKTTEFWSTRLGRNVTPDEAEKPLEAIPDFVERRG